jgi:hypothetical protein
MVRKSHITFLPDISKFLLISTLSDFNRFVRTVYTNISVYAEIAIYRKASVPVFRTRSGSKDGLKGHGAVQSA